MDNRDKIYDRFNDEVLQTIVFAKAASINANVDCIYPQSFILGMLTTGQNEVTSLLLDMDVNLEMCVRKFKQQLEKKQEDNSKNPEIQDLAISKQVWAACTMADEISREMGNGDIGVKHIFLALLQTSGEIKAVFEKEQFQLVDFIKRTKAKKNHVKSRISRGTRASKTAPKVTPTLEAFCVNMTQLARDNKLDPILTRESEIESAITTLCRRTKNNPILVGSPGVGKTAIVEGLSQRIVAGTVPRHLIGCELYSMSMSSLVAGTKYRGQFEERIEALIKEVVDTPDCILFIDEIHTLIGAGSAQGSLDASNILKPFLARGELRCIGATTLEEYKKHFRKEGALNRRFQQILVEETTKSQTIQILHGVKPKLEEFHQCIISDDAIEAIVNLTDRYQPTKNFPDKAIDCLDTACAKKSAWGSEGDNVILVEDVARVLGDELEIPSEVILWGDFERVKKIKDILDTRVIGQHTAIDVICRSLKNSYSGVRNPDKPIGSFVFGGQTGTGKTYTAKELALALFQKESSFIRVDMSEFSEKHTVSKLIGSPPGYVGFQEVEVFLDRVQRKPYSVILLDEIEKAHPNVLKLFLQVMSDGFMTDAVGTRVNFKNTILIMTGNFGMNELAKNSLGFEEEHQSNLAEEEQKRLVTYCKEKFGEEFVNRVDEFVPFLALEEDALHTIAGLRLKELVARIAENRTSKITFTKKAHSQLVSLSHNEHGKNAGILNRLISKRIEPCLADALISVGGDQKTSITIDAKDGEFTYRTRKSPSRKTSRKTVKKR